MVTGICKGYKSTVHAAMPKLSINQFKPDDQISKQISSDEFELKFFGSSEPWAGKVPSRAELGHFNFRAETELTILRICMSKNSDFVPLSWFYVQFYEFT